MDSLKRRRYERDLLKKESASFLDVSKSARELLILYESLGIPLNPQCSLHRLISSSIEIARDWEDGIQVGDDRIDDLINGKTLLRVISAVSSLHENERPHIKEFRRGCLLPSKRSQSKAKDKLWELELLAIFRGHGIEVEINEPDMILAFPSGHLSVACKRIYSEKNSENSMSYGIKQISLSGNYGILAVNIDDLSIPEEGILIAPDIQLAQKALSEINAKFASRHEKRLQRYMSEGRALAVLISTWAPVYLENSGISACRDTLIWSRPNLSNQAEQLIAEFESHFYE